MVQEILTVSRMESSGFSLRREIFDFSGLVERQLVHFEDLIEQKQLVLSQSITPALSVNADKNLLRKVVNNIFSNAVSYSPPGSYIIVSIVKQEHKVGFSVENTGVHLPEEDLPKLFDAFYRVDPSRNRQTGGSGLGLYLIKMILEQHSIPYEMGNTADGVKFSMVLP